VKPPPETVRHPALQPKTPDLKGVFINTPGFHHLTKQLIVKKLKDFGTGSI
jgi:hypothetical protein